MSALLLGGMFVLPSVLLSYGIPLPSFQRATPAPLPAPPPIAMIQSLADLVPTRAHISDTLEGSNNHYKVRYALHGEALIGIDLSKITYAQVQPDLRKAVLRLPAPHVVSVTVDHDRSYEIRLDWVAWIPTSNPGQLREEVWKQADLKLRRLAQEPGYHERARVEAERVLTRLFEGLNWKVSFEWQDRLPASENRSASPAASPGHVHTQEKAVVERPGPPGRDGPQLGDTAMDRLAEAVANVVETPRPNGSTLPSANGMGSDHAIQFQGEDNRK
jgi:hypothetical protein